MNARSGYFHYFSLLLNAFRIPDAGSSLRPASSALRPLLTSSQSLVHLALFSTFILLR
jgi:hypothetical protein